jgi:hypothetical protein
MEVYARLYLNLTGGRELRSDHVQMKERFMELSSNYEHVEAHDGDIRSNDERIVQLKMASLGRCMARTTEQHIEELDALRKELESEGLTGLLEGPTIAESRRDEYGDNFYLEKHFREKMFG